MSTKMKELIAAVLITAFFLAAYFWFPKPLNFSPTVSLILIIIMALTFVYIGIRTFMGKFVERRIVFVYVGVALTLPFFMQFKLPVPISPEVQSAFDAVKNLSPGSKILAAYDYDPPSEPELQPMADAFMKYCFDHELKVIIVGLWPQGPQQADQSIEAALEYKPEFAQKVKYGEDYVNLGFQSGNEFVILRMGESFKAMFPKDVNGTPYEDIPLLKGVKNYSNIDYCMNFSAGKPGTQEWVQGAVDRYGLKMSAGNTAVQAPMMYPFLQGGQLDGLMGGMAGAAEFELLTGYPGKASTYIKSQTFAHVVVVFFIIIGNLAFFKTGRRKK
ncbi:MAG: hypothetical protein ABIJ45_10675 [Candidatus Zixiibacteriota bacterium]